jgi:hypothetical protein
MMGIQSGMSSDYDRFVTGTNTFQVTTVGTEVPFMMLKQASELKPLGELCYISINIDWFNFATNTTVLWKLYRNRRNVLPTLVHVTDQLTLCPVTVGIIGGPGAPGTNPVLAADFGILIFSWHCISGATFQVDMTPFNVWLDQDDTIVLTCTSLAAGANNASFSCGYSNYITHQ